MWIKKQFGLRIEHNETDRYQPLQTIELKTCTRADQTDFILWLKDLAKRT